MDFKPADITALTQPGGPWRRDWRSTKAICPIDSLAYSKHLRAHTRQRQEHNHWQLTGRQSYATLCCVRRFVCNRRFNFIRAIVLALQPISFIGGSAAIYITTQRFFP